MLTPCVRLCLGEGTRYSGTVEATHDGRVMAEVPGRVVALEVKEGEWVERGAVIARLDGELLRLQLEAAQVQVGGLEKGPCPLYHTGEGRCGASRAAGEDRR